MYNDATMGTNVAELKKPEPKRQTEISKALECLEKEMLHRNGKRNVKENQE